VEFRPLEKLLQRVFSEVAGLDTTASKFPVSVVSIEVTGGGSARAGLDPNLEPNKQRVGLSCAATLLAGLEQHLRQVYGLRGSEAVDNFAATDELNDSYGRLLKNCADTERQLEENNCGYEVRYDPVGRGDSCSNDPRKTKNSEHSAIAG
jgi:hypothetical protein